VTEKKKTSWNNVKGGALCMVVGIVLLVLNNPLGNYFGYGLLALGLIGIVWGAIGMVRGKVK
jgi:hypothetical protein